ncbi:MAG TPA: right-handed parallel beta-helix repeat-containing protein, partial [Methanocella sp.]|nr:right-handed parallel beta-helix repeat-containing protein [Methanocella sp.]
KDLNGGVITKNTCKDNTEIDLYIENITNTLIDGNRMEDNEHASRSGGDGIGMRYGNNITISNNYVGKHYYGIKVYYSDLVNVTNNTAENSGVNIRVDFGTKDSNVTHNIVKNGVDNILLGGGSTRILIEYNAVSSGKDGVYLFSSSNDTVRHNNVQGSEYGIRLYESTDNLITLNYLHENDNDLYPDATGSIASDNSNRANYFGPDKSQVTTATPTPESTPVTSTPSAPTATPSQNQKPTDIISQIIELIRGLFSW